MSVNRSKLIVVQDDADTISLLEHHFSNQGYEVNVFQRLDEAEASVETAPPNLVIFDSTLPGISSIEFSRRWKTGANRNVPLVVLTAMDGERERVSALDAGADDFVAKPFSMPELAARVHAALRRAKMIQDRSKRRVGALAIDFETRRVWHADREVELTLTEYRLLVLFFASPGRTFTHDELVVALRGPEVTLARRSVGTCVSRLKQSLAVDGRRAPIVGIRGVGFVLLAQAAERDEDDRLGYPEAGVAEASRRQRRSRRKFLSRPASGS